MYGRTLDGRELTFGASGWLWRNTFLLADHQTRSLWWGGAGPEALETLVCVAGPLQDERLPRHGRFTRGFWRRWAELFPATLYMFRWR